MNYKLIQALYKIVASKKIFFHGTSSKFLRSILKQGILPTSKEGVWRDQYIEKDTDVLNPSKRSLEGSYWTSSVLNASSYANEAKRKLGGNLLFIAARLETKTTLPDEDDFLGVIERGINRLWGPEYTTGHSERAWVSVYHAILLNKKYGKDALKNWRNIFTEWLNAIYPNKKYQTVEYTKILDRLLLVELRRRISYMDKYQYKNVMDDQINRIIYPKKIDRDAIEDTYPQPNPSEEENNRRKYVDLLSRKVQKLVDNDKINQTLRITSPVTFSGANKIIMILEVFQKDNYKEFKVHYGEIPTEFLSEWKQNIGRNFEILS